MVLRFPLALMLLALPAQAATIEAQFACRFDQVCTQDDCTMIDPLDGRFAAQKDGKASLIWPHAPGTPLALIYEMTPRNTVMANGMDQDVLVLLTLAEDGLVAMTRLSTDGRQEKLLGLCE